MTPGTSPHIPRLGSGLCRLRPWSRSREVSLTLQLRRTQTHDLSVPSAACRVGAEGSLGREGSRLCLPRLPAVGRSAVPPTLPPAARARDRGSPPPACSGGSGPRSREPRLWSARDLGLGTCPLRASGSPAAHSGDVVVPTRCWVRPGPRCTLAGGRRSQPSLGWDRCRESSAVPPEASSLVGLEGLEEAVCGHQVWGHGPTAGCTRSRALPARELACQPSLAFWAHRGRSPASEGEVGREPGTKWRQGGGWKVAGLEGLAGWRAE